MQIMHSNKVFSWLHTVKSIIQPAGYKGFRGFWGRAIVKGAGYLLSKFTKNVIFHVKIAMRVIFKGGLYYRFYGKLYFSKQS